jgi:hypothetical protein
MVQTILFLQNADFLLSIFTFCLDTKRNKKYHEPSDSELMNTIENY